MPYKKKQAIPGTVQFKLKSELPEKRRIKGQIEFRNDILESQNGLVIRTNSIGYKVLRNCLDWMPTQKQK